MKLIHILLETIEKHDILLELFMCNTYCTKYRDIGGTGLLAKLYYFS
jgi:hypothetical protein